MASALETLAKEGYAPIDRKSPLVLLKWQWINEYLTGVSEYLEEFVIKDGKESTEFLWREGPAGYVFIQDQHSHDYEKRMLDLMQQYNAGGKRTLRYFVDKEDKIAGFSWLGKE